MGLRATYKIAGEIYKGALVYIEGIFTLLGDDFFNSTHSNEEYDQI